MCVTHDDYMYLIFYLKVSVTKPELVPCNLDLKNLNKVRRIGIFLGRRRTSKTKL